MILNRRDLFRVTAGAIGGLVGSKLGRDSKQAEGELTVLEDLLSLLNSVGDDYLLVRRQEDKWAIVHREPKTKVVEYGGGYGVHYGGHVFMVTAITQNTSGKMKLFELWRIE